MGSLCPLPLDPAPSIPPEMASQEEDTRPSEGMMLPGFCEPSITPVVREKECQTKSIRSGVHERCSVHLLVHRRRGLLVLESLLISPQTSQGLEASHFGKGGYAQVLLTNRSGCYPLPPAVLTGR